MKNSSGSATRRGEIVIARAELPVAEHADNRVVDAVHAHGLADAVLPAEQFLVRILRQHDDARVLVILLAVPWSAIRERRLEHREEIGERSRGRAS